MKVGVISDTHDHLPAFASAVSLFRDAGVEAIFHAGDYVAPMAAIHLSPKKVDVPVYAIYGNNDGDRHVPGCPPGELAGLHGVLPQLQDGPLRVELHGRTIVMHHFLRWLQPHETAGVDVVISGHDHKPCIETRSGTLYVNPGECCGWRHGRRTVALLDLAAMKAEIVDVPV